MCYKIFKFFFTGKVILLQKMEGKFALRIYMPFGHLLTQGWIFPPGKYAHHNITCCGAGKSNQRYYDLVQIGPLHVIPDSNFKIAATFPKPQIFGLINFLVLIYVPLVKK